MKSDPPDIPKTTDTLTLRRKLLFSVIAVTGGLLLIECGARLWLRVAAPRPPEARQVESNWFGLLKNDLATPLGGPDLYVPDPHLFWTLRPKIEFTATN